MRILVGVKRVIDYAVRVRVATDGKGVELANTKMSMNPFCEIAVEEAIKLKEAGKAKEVVVVSIGPKQATETLRSAIAMGADRAVHVKTDRRLDQELEPLAVAKLLKAVVEAQKPDLVLLGKQSIDSDNGSTAPMLAELLGWPQVTFASKVEVTGSQATVERETDAGTEVLEVPLPAVISADLRLNTPRYPKLPNIMKAKKKPLDELNVEDLGVDLSPRNVVVSVANPPPRKEGITVDDVDSLIAKLKETGVIS